MTPIQLYASLRETLTAELELAASYFDRVDPSEIVEETRSAIRKVLELVNADERMRSPTSLIEELVHESRTALVPVHIKLGHISNALVLQARRCIRTALDYCTEVQNDLERGL